jgi:O-antigen biosynthesis protein WbqP
MPQITEEKIAEFETQAGQADVHEDSTEKSSSKFSLKDFNYMVEHSDEFYASYIENFEPRKGKRLFYRFFKRAFDIIVSALAILIFSPLFLIVAIAIKCDSKGPVIFRHKRIGKGGKEFTCLKFRSMKTDTPADCATSLLEHPELHYTKVGRVLRRLSIDELPQFFCVFIGTMSFIGYRPLVVTEKKCNEMRKRLGVLDFRPGISGYSQVHGRDDLYYKNKAILDAEYTKMASLWLDLKLIFLTVWVAIKREGNDAEKIEAKTEVKK